jgi:hypothetical protein
MEAALNGQIGDGRALMRHGADASMKDGDGKTAADHAGARGTRGWRGVWGQSRGRDH